MKVVVDTNVIAYYVLETEPFIQECREFWRHVSEAIAPASWEAELINVLWFVATRKQTIDLPEAARRLDFAGALSVRSVPVTTLWRGALARAYESGVTAYDTLFVELAEMERVPLVTFDNQVLKAFPNLARRPGDISAHS